MAMDTGILNLQRSLLIDDAIQEEEGWLHELDDVDPFLELEDGDPEGYAEEELEIELESE